MKKVIGLISILGLAALLAAGCASQGSSSSTSSTLVNSSTAATYSELGVSLTQDVNNTISNWASSGNINTGVSVLGIRASSANAQSISTPDADGYYHITETATASANASLIIDLYGKLTTASGKVTAVDAYGTITTTIGTSSASVTYVVSFGNGRANPYHGVPAYTGNTVTSFTTSGTISETITAGTGTTSHTIVLTFTPTSFSFPVTSGSDYPTGTLPTTITFDGTSVPGLTITFNGTSTATITFSDGTTTTFTFTGT